jgi:hypothetical protein
LPITSRVTVASLVLAATASVATSRSKNVVLVQGEIVVSPALYDLGDVPLGPADADFEVRWVTGSAIDVTDVGVGDVLGGTFAGPDASELPVTIDEAQPYRIRVQLDPIEEGYHLGVVDISSNAKDCLVSVLVRGHAAAASAEVGPTTLDFGDVGQEGATLQLELVNTGRLPLRVRSGEVSDDAFVFGGDELPELPVGQIVRVPVEVVPFDGEPLSGTLTLDLGEGLDAVVVQLRANDCENGSPVAYDADGDGVTSCGTSVPAGADADGDGFTVEDGDCDDADPERLACGDPIAEDLDGDGFTVGDGDCDDADGWNAPGRQELCDGADNDCDGEADDDCEGATVLETCGTPEDSGCGGCDSSGSPSSAVAALGLLFTLRGRRTGLRGTSRRATDA